MSGRCVPAGRRTGYSFQAQGRGSSRSGRASGCRANGNADSVRTVLRMSADLDQALPGMGQTIDGVGRSRFDLCANRGRSQDDSDAGGSLESFGHGGRHLFGISSALVADKRDDGQVQAQNRLSRWVWHAVSLPQRSFGATQANPCLLPSRWGPCDTDSTGERVR